MELRSTVLNEFHRESGILQHVQDQFQRQQLGLERRMNRAGVNQLRLGMTTVRRTTVATAVIATALESTAAPVRSVAQLLAVPRVVARTRLQANVAVLLRLRPAALRTAAMTTREVTHGQFANRAQHQKGVAVVFRRKQTALVGGGGRRR